MITEFLPIGLKGLAIAGLLAAMMSSLSSAFNSSSTLFTMDFYQKYKPKASDHELVVVGQIATVVLVVLSLGWIPFMKALMGGGIFHYLQSIQAYISPPIAAVFLLGLYFKWINARGAIVSLWAGFILGISRIVSEFLVNQGTIQVSKNSLFDLFLSINFLHYAILLFVFCSAVLMLVSKWKPSEITEEIDSVTFTRPMSFQLKISSDLILTGVLILLVLLLWTIFSPLGLG